MPYAVEWASPAEDDLAKLDPMEASFVLDQIDRLAASPQALCTAPGFPHPEHFWKFSFWCREEADRVFITVLFSWSKTDDSIRIEMIGVTRY
jgi:hypothetical protein